MNRESNPEIFAFEGSAQIINPLRCKSGQFKIAFLNCLVTALTLRHCSLLPSAGETNYFELLYIFKIFLLSSILPTLPGHPNRLVLSFKILTKCYKECSSLLWNFPRPSFPFSMVPHILLSIFLFSNSSGSCPSRKVRDHVPQL